MIESAYIHIPFCRRKCSYCTFSSYPKINLKNQYIAALCFEIEKRYRDDILKTMYIGGGTPSLLEISDIRKIISYFNFDNEAEITCEINPENLSYKWLQELFQIGVNRISIGVQTFDEKLLSLIGRKHSVKEAFQAVNNAQKAGFSNISIDLIYGLPSQTMKDIAASVIIACEMGIPHISTYGLKIEKGSVFYKQKLQNRPDEEMQADMYLKIIEITKKYGYKHYEISNFAKESFESKHNLNYWNANNYYGFGCAAAGYENEMRYVHQKTIEKYCQNPLILTGKEFLTPEILLEEAIFLGLRKSEGINIKQINQKFGINFEEKYKKILEKYARYFIQHDCNYAFTDEGFLISNCILSDFIQ